MAATPTATSSTPAAAASRSSGQGEVALLPFGISDLNRLFDLNAEPHNRQITAATAFVTELLPPIRQTFIYSGGELSYLRNIGARVEADGRCDAGEFLRVAAWVDDLPTADLEIVSPFDAGWSTGAIASNAIVRACLERSSADHYYASDINIADGIIASIGGCCSQLTLVLTPTTRLGCRALQRSEGMQRARSADCGLQLRRRFITEHENIPPLPRSASHRFGGEAKPRPAWRRHKAAVPLRFTPIASMQSVGHW